MSAPRPRRGAGLLTALLALGSASLVPAAAPAAGADPSDHGHASATGISVRPLTGTVGSVRGRAALQRIEGRVPAVARLNGFTATRLTEVLRTDRTAWLDRDDRLYFVDPGAPAGPSGSAAGGAAEAPAYPAAATFSLHSKPGSQHVIFLDFDGATVSGTAWNDSGVTSGPQPGWSLDGDPGTFSAGEDAVVQSVWARVAEDYAPFDVDVTTEDPGEAAIDRSGSSDPTYGTRALISPSSQAATALCGNQCGGIAYVNVFAEPSSHAYYQPAWIFPQNLGEDTKAIAEAVAHEVGHNFGLSHDGNSVQGYDKGHGAWAPIMGASYYVPITQWSKGDYPDANNHEDDVSIIAASAPLRPDEAGGTVATAAGTLPSGTAYVTSRGDVDYYALGHCTGSLGVTATPAATSPDLDVQLRLVRADGTVVTTADPASSMVDYDTASGLGATLSATVPAGDYLVAVDGVGNGGWSTGYDDYGSLGAYTLALAQGSCNDATNAPGVPQAVSATAGADGRSATVHWSAPASDGGSPITGYVVGRTGGAPVTAPAGATSQLLTGLEPGTTYTLTVAATNDAGTGDAASTTVTTLAAPSVPTAVTGTYDGGVATLAWGAPASDGGSAVTGYEVRLDGGGWLTEPASSRLHAFTGLTGSTHTLAVRAVNAVGTGAESSVTVSTLQLPDAPQGLGAAVAKDGTVRLTWIAPPDGGSPLTGYVVTADGQQVGTLAASATGAVVTGLSRGTTHQLGVAAVNAAGTGTFAGVSVQVPATAPGVPALGRARPGNAGKPYTATVRWKAPVDDGGAPLTRYRVKVLALAANGHVQQAQKFLVPATSPVFGVKARTRLRVAFQVQADNGHGWSRWTGRSAAVRLR